MYSILCVTFDGNRLIDYCVPSKFVGCSSAYTVYLGSYGCLDSDFLSVECRKGVVKDRGVLYYSMSSYFYVYFLFILVFLDWEHHSGGPGLVGHPPTHGLGRGVLFLSICCSYLCNVEMVKGKPNEQYGS
jgi:hypothetical protein